MARDEQVYGHVMQSPLLSQPMQQVYWVLWSYEQGLTKGEIVNVLRSSNLTMDEKAPWEKQLSTMAKMGIVKKGNKRHCTAKNKVDVVWFVTDRAEPIKPKANKPSAKAYIKAIAQFESVIAQHDQMGDGMITTELRRLYEWVRDKVEVK